MKFHKSLLERIITIYNYYIASFYATTIEDSRFELVLCTCKHVYQISIGFMIPLADKLFRYKLNLIKVTLMKVQDKSFIKHESISWYKIKLFSLAKLPQSSIKYNVVIGVNNKDSRYVI